MELGKRAEKSAGDADHAEAPQDVPPQIPPVQQYPGEVVEEMDNGRQKNGDLDIEEQRHDRHHDGSHAKPGKQGDDRS